MHEFCYILLQEDYQMDYNRIIAKPDETHDLLESATPYNSFCLHNLIDSCVHLRARFIGYAMRQVPSMPTNFRSNHYRRLCSSLCKIL